MGKQRNATGFALEFELLVQDEHSDRFPPDTVEGHCFRRLLGIKVLRNRSPFDLTQHIAASSCFQPVPVGDRSANRFDGGHETAIVLRHRHGEIVHDLSPTLRLQEPTSR